MDVLTKLEEPDEEKKDIFEGCGEEEGYEDSDYVYLKAEDLQESQRSQESSPSLVGNLDAIELAKD